MVLNVMCYFFETRCTYCFFCRRWKFFICSKRRQAGNVCFSCILQSNQYKGHNKLLSSLHFMLLPSWTWLGLTLHF